MYLKDNFFIRENIHPYLLNNLFYFYFIDNSVIIPYIIFPILCFFYFFLKFFVNQTQPYINNFLNGSRQVEGPNQGRINTQKGRESSWVNIDLILCYHIDIGRWVYDATSTLLKFACHYLLKYDLGLTTPSHVLIIHCMQFVPPPCPITWIGNFLFLRKFGLNHPNY